MTNITFMGLGAMGERMVRALLRAAPSISLRVYNRTPARASALADEFPGVEVAGTPADAVRDAELAIACVRDDTASRALWLDGGALAALPTGATVVTSSTLSLQWTDEFAERARARGLRFIDAPVVGSRPQADAGQLVHLVGGESEDLQATEPLLARLASGRRVHVGPPGSGMRMKLAVNTLFALQVSALGEVLGLLERAGVPRGVATELLGELPTTSPALQGIGAAIARGGYDPLFPIELVEKDLGYALATASSEQSAKLPQTQAGRATFARAIDEGLGAENIHAVAKLFLAG